MRVFPSVIGYALKGISLPLKHLVERHQEAEPRSDAIETATNRAYGAHPKQKMDVYYTRRQHQLPVVIYIHGGFWVAGDKDQHRAHCHHIAQSGYTVFAINYRLAPRHTYATQIKDVSIAIKAIYDRAHQFKGDNQQILLVGECSGANLGISYANALFHEHLRKNLNLDKLIPREVIRGLVLVHGIHDQDGNFFVKMPFRRCIQSVFLGDKDFYVQIELASPARHLAATLPPVLIIAGEIDPLFSQSKDLADRLKEKGVNTQTLFYDQQSHPSAQHYFMHWRQHPETKQAMKSLLKFLNKQTIPMGNNVIPLSPFQQLS